MSYEEVLNLSRQLSGEQRLRLADTLLAEELGFGMWQGRADLADVNATLAQIRAAQAHTPAGRALTPEEFLRWVEADDD